MIQVRCAVAEKMRDKADSRERGSTSQANDCDIRRPAVPTLSDWCLRRIIQVAMLACTVKCYFSTDAVDSLVISKGTRGIKIPIVKNQRKRDSGAEKRQRDFDNNRVHFKTYTPRKL